MFQEGLNRFIGKKLFPSDSPENFRFRQQSWEKFHHDGLPNRKNEDWKYSNPKNVFQKNFDFATKDSPAVVLSTSLKNSYALFFENGILNSVQSQLKELGLAGVEVTVTSEMSPQLGFLPLGKSSSIKSHFMYDLNSAYAQQQVIIKISAGKKIQRPIEFVFQNALDNLFLCPRIKVIFESQSEATIFETFQNPKSFDFFSNTFFEIQVQENAKAKWYTCTDDGDVGFNYSNHLILLDESSHLDKISFNCQSGFFKNVTEVFHLQPLAESKIKSLSVTKNENHSDHFSAINHLMGQGTSTQLYKSILSGQSRSVFKGQIFIQKQAQKVISEQKNKNLLLSSRAEVDSLPQLEILADDVKANHGSAIGQINPEEIFYLQSRGFNRQQAFETLAVGFGLDIFSEITHPEIRTFFHDRARKNLVDVTVDAEDVHGKTKQ